MYSANKIIWNLAQTELLTKSKIAEILGCSVTDVHQSLKEGPELKNEHEVYYKDECIFNYCPTPDLCKEHGCTSSKS